MTTGVEKQKGLDKKHGDMTKQAEGKRCARCKELVRVAWLDGEWKFRCGCYPIIPTMEKPNVVGERLGEIVKQSLVIARSEQQIQRLSEDVVTTYLCPFATKGEAYLFIKMCQALDLNPFIHEAYLVKYDKNDKAAFVIGVQAFIKWASRNPNYAGKESGVIVQSGKNLEYRDGSLILPGETLVGGWCKVYRKDWTVAPRHTVAFSEYDKKQFLWKTHPATMIEKVAITQHLRRSFPEDVGYQYQLVQQQAKAEGLELSSEVEGHVVNTETGEIIPPKPQQEPQYPQVKPANAPKRAQKATTTPQAEGQHVQASTGPNKAVPSDVMKEINDYRSQLGLDTAEAMGTWAATQPSLAMWVVNGRIQISKMQYDDLETLREALYFAVQNQAAQEMQ